MKTLDLFNTVYERALNEGAVDDLEARRIHHLNTRMLELMSRATEPEYKANPAARASLMKQYAKVKDERDSYYKVNTNEGAMKRWLESQALRMSKDRFVSNAGEYGMSDQEAEEFWHNINGVEEAGIPGNVPVEKIPGKEDLLKGKGRSYYEDQKKNSETGPLDQKLQRLKVQARRQFPLAHTDDEALILKLLDKETQDDQANRRTDARQDAELRKNFALDREQDDDIDNLQTQVSVKEHGGGIGPKQHWQDLMQERKLSAGDPVVVTAPNEFEGKTGEIHELSPSGKFVIVDLYNHGKHSMHLSDVEYNQYADEQEEDDWYDEGVAETAAWRRKEGKSKSGGLNAKGVASYRRENPGSKLQTAVTTKPSKLKKGSKAAKRRKSFCARMGGVKGPMKKPNGKPTRKALALRKWNCEGMEHLDAQLASLLSEGWSDAIVARRTGTPRTPYSVYIKGKKWKDFENDDHAEAVANKLRAKFKAEGRDPSVITIAPTDMSEAINKKDLLSKVTKDLNSGEFKNTPVDSNRKGWTGASKDDYGYTGYQGHGMPTDKQERARIRADKKKGVAEGFEYASKVQHPKYGSGQVVKVYPNGMITVNFPTFLDPIDKKPGIQGNFMPGDSDYQSLKSGMTESTDDIKKKMSKLEALALAANRAGDDTKCKMYQQKIQSLKQKLSQSMTEEVDQAGALKAAQAAAKFIIRNLDDRAALKDYSMHFWSPAKFYQGATMAMRGVGFDEIVRHITQDQPAQFEATGDSKFDAMMGKINKDPWTQLNSDPNWEYEIEELVDQHIEPWLLAMEKSGMPITQDNETLNPGWRKRYEQISTQLAQKYLASKKFNPRDPDLVGRIRAAIDNHTDQSRNVHGQLSAYAADLPMQRYADAFDADGMTANIRDAMAGLAPRGDDDDGYAPRPAANPRRLDPGNMEEAKADPSGSWVVYNGNKVKRFKSHDGAKAYAEKAGGKVASSEYYADKIQKSGVDEAIVASGPSRPLDDRAVRKMVWDTMKINADTGEQAIQRALAVLAKKPQSRMVQDLQDKFQSLADRLAQDVAETVTDTRAGMAEIYRRLAPKIERYRDSFLAGQLYDELENYAELHGAEREFKQMMNGARNRAHMEYDTNPGGFHNWFWFLPFADEELSEEQDTSGVERAILNRIMVAHTDLLLKFGPDKVMQAAEEVAYNVGDVDEIGTSDVSAYVAQVKQILGAVNETQVNEKWSAKYKSSINCASPKGFSQKAHCAGKKK
jgi:hypothetical protein